MKKYADIQTLRNFHKRMRDFIHRTPVLRSSYFDLRTGAEVFFKCENFQKMGAFKMRGAVNAVLCLSKEERARGIAAHSSGNFAQAVALAGRLLGVSSTLIMPTDAPSVKKEAVQEYGGFIIECAPGQESRKAALAEFIAATGAVPLHPSNQQEVIEGNSTAAIEFLDEVPELDAVITPVGGGGLLAGTALAAKQLKPAIEVYAGEPFAVDDAYCSLRTGQIQPPTNKPTVADGLKTCLGDVNFPIIKKYVTAIIRVEEEEIIDAMKRVWERMKIVIEPSSAVPVAAVLREPERFRGKKVGIIVSGGNVELGRKLPWLVN
jgi:threonine dehydratase